MADFSQRALAIQPTGVRKMFDLAGDDVISFGLGEPDFQPPPLAIEAFHQAVGGKIPIIGVGGIMSPSDAQAKIEAGATLLQLYSGFIYHGPRLIRKILSAGPENP